MNKVFTNIYPIINLYKKMSTRSEVVTQMIYGDSFSVVKKTTKWLKIKSCKMADKERVDLLKQVYSKSEYTKIIDTSFSQLGVESIPDQLNNVFTVADFFQQYDLLFYDIPAEGDINSHQYLVETSGEYIGFDKDNDLIK